jgi:hypothetical protein
MSATTQDIVRDKNGRFYYNIIEDDCFKSLIEEIQHTREWKEFVRDFYSDDNAEQYCDLLIRATIARVYRVERRDIDSMLADLAAKGVERPLVSGQQFYDTLCALINNGEFKNFLPDDPEPVVDTRPRGADGKFLSDAQIQLQEFETFVAANTSDACRERARVDRAFGDFYRRQNLRELNSTPVETATAANAHQKGNRVDAALLEFANTYRLMPMDEVRRLSSRATNPLGAAEFNRKFDLCSKNGLI